MMKTSVTKEITGENVYLNINMANPLLSPISIKAAFSQTLNQAIVDKPSDYNLILSRFSIPGTAIPIFIFKTLGYPATTDINQGLYSVSIQYNGSTTAQTYLEWIPLALVPPYVPVFSALQPNQSNDDPYYFNYSYHNLADMVTIAIRAAITAGSGFLPGGTDAYMIYSDEAGFFSILGTQGMYHSKDPTDPLNVRIFINTPLASLLTGFKFVHNGVNTANGLDEAIIVQDNLNNSPTTQDGFNPNIPDGYYQVPQEFSADSSLEKLTRIVVTSSAFGGVVPQSELSTLSTSSYLPIIADFVPSASTMAGSYRSRFQYYAQSEFFRRQLTQSSPLVSIALHFYWQSLSDSDFHEPYIYSGEVLSIQFIFEKKKNV